MMVLIFFGSVFLLIVSTEHVARVNTSLTSREVSKLVPEEEERINEAMPSIRGLVVK